MHKAQTDNVMYAILISGQIDARRFVDLEPISVEFTGEGNTLLVKEMADQSQLFSVLTHRRDLGVTLLRVEIFK